MPPLSHRHQLIHTAPVATPMPTPSLPASGITPPPPLPIQPKVPPIHCTMLAFSLRVAQTFSTSGVRFVTLPRPPALPPPLICMPAINGTGLYQFCRGLVRGGSTLSSLHGQLSFSYMPRKGFQNTDRRQRGSSQYEGSQYWERMKGKKEREKKDQEREREREIRTNDTPHYVHTT